MLGRHGRRRWMVSTPAALLAVLGAASPEAAEIHGHNVLLIVADDVGVQDIGLYGVGTSPAHTPYLDGLATQGMRFRNAWSNPLCSVTRATILSGRYGFRTSVTQNMSPSTPWRLDSTERLLPSVLNELPLANHANAAFGKWHLANCQNGAPPVGTPDPSCSNPAMFLGMTHPNDAGFQHYSGTPANFGDAYFSWCKVTNGAAPTLVNNYATLENVQNAAQWIAGRPAGSSWFVYLAFNAAHAAFHVPPHNLFPLTAAEVTSLPPEQNECPGPLTQRYCYRAMIEAMDTAIGQLVEGLSPAVRSRTTIIFVGDNGTPIGVNPGTVYPDTHVKGSVYQGGVNVPLIVNGPGVVTGVTDLLVNTTDLFETTVQLVAGVPSSTVLPSSLDRDSSSLVPILAGGTQPVRTFAYAELLVPPGLPADDPPVRAIRDSRYKLIRKETGSLPIQELYDLQTYPFVEGANLLGAPLSTDAARHLAQLQSRLAGLMDQASEMCPIEASCSANCGCPALPPATGVCQDQARARCTRYNGDTFSCAVGQTIHLEPQACVNNANASTLTCYGLCYFDLSSVQRGQRMYCATPGTGGCDPPYCPCGTGNCP